MKTIVPESRRSWRCPHVLFSAFLIGFLASAPAARALIEVSVGNDPVADAGWPAGSVDVANLESRIGFWVGPPLGGGEYHFEYHGDTAEFQRALDLLAKVDARERLVVVHEGPATSTFLEDTKDPKAKARYDWGFVVWDKASYDRLYKGKKNSVLARDPNFGRPMPPPRIDVYVGAAPPGEGVDWSRVTVPANVKVTDERASANGFPPDAGSVLRGRVTNLASGKPVAGARVLVTSWSQERQAYDDVTSATSRDDGKFEVTRVPPGASYRVHVEAPGHAPRLIGYESFGKDTLKEFPDVRIAPAATFAGKLVATDGKPISGVKVFATDVVTADGFGYSAPAEAATMTDGAGRFAFTNLPAGTCRLIVQAQGYHAIEPLKKHTIPSDALEFRMAATGNVHGKVTVNGGAPDAPFIAEITPEGGNKVGSWGGSTQLKADGTFEFNGVPPGKYVVTARPNPGPVIKGKDPNEKLIEVKAGITLDVEIAVK